MWKDPETRKEKYSVEERFSYRNFTLQEVFETLECSNYNRLDVENYYNLDSWPDYCNFLSHNPSIRKPKNLIATEWNGLGIDEEV
jgi:hypothetical protein